MKLRCIIFDMDGTLTQTNQLIFDSFNFIAEKYRGRRYSETEIRSMFGPPEEEALRAIVPTEDIELVMANYLQFYRDNHERLAILYPGIGQLLEQLRARGCWLALFTGKGKRTTVITLEACQVGQFFDTVVTGSDVTRYKPSGEGILRILGECGVTPGETIVVGDSVVDMLAARDAGVRCASVLWDSYRRDEVLQRQPDHVFESVESLSSFLLEHAAPCSARTAHTDLR